MVRGYVRKDTWQAQFTATQVFANVLKASQAVLLFEGAVDYIPGLENKYSGGPVGLGLRYEAPGTNLSGSPELGSYPQFPNLYEPGSAFPTSTSWGYVVAGRLEYANLIASWNILPHFTWSQDVSGISPGPGGNFIEGRHALTLGVGASLRSKWDLDVSYTQYGGADPERQRVAAFDEIATGTGEMPLTSWLQVKCGRMFHEAMRLAYSRRPATTYPHGCWSGTPSRARRGSETAGSCPARDCR